MECDLLIDFNSPQKGGVNVLDPLVPLPKVQARDLHNNEAVSSVGDNPFDNVFLQLCREDDPFDMIEKRAKETKVETINKDSSLALQTINLMHKDYKQGIQGSLGLPQKFNPVINRESYDVSDIHHSSLFSEKSEMELIISPGSAGIENKFSKLYMSTQFDKQILEESSKCIDSGMHDVSLEGTYRCDVSSRSNKSASVIALDLPNKDDEIKAFIANRIERCIEKAVTETRKSLNSSHKHRRSLSAASVYPNYEPSAINLEKNILPSLVLNNSKWCSSFSGKNKSLSNHDLPSLQNTNLWKNPKGNINLYGNEKFTVSGVSDKFNTGFRKSTATSSMYSSFGLLDTGFHLNKSIFRNAKSSSSVFNMSSPQIGEDSVFINNDKLERKSSDCVLMEAKNLSFLLQRRIRSAGDEPLDNDYNFLSDNKCDIELVDSSFSENEDANLSFNSNENVACPENPLPTKENTLATKLKSNAPLVRNSHNVILAPPLPVPINSSSNSRELVLRPRGHSDGRVISKGPMKAMIPLGSMVRTSSEKERNLSTRQDEGNEHKNADTKLVPSCSSVKKSAKGESVSQSNKFISSALSRLNSPLGRPFGGPVACSTPASEDTRQLVSPPIALQVSNISPSSPTKRVHRRSRSAGNKDGNVVETESKLISTPTRKVPRRIRSEDGRLKCKQKSPPLLSPKPAYTSTPLKLITRNSPPVNRMKKNLPITRKLLQPKEKENIQPHRPVRGLKLLSRNSRV